MDNYVKERFDEVVEALRGERLYQAERWKDEPSQGMHEVDSYLTYIRCYLRFVENIVSTMPARDGDEPARRVLRKIAALCCAACEQNGGMPPRESDPPWLRLSRPAAAVDSEEVQL